MTLDRELCEDVDCGISICVAKCLAQCLTYKYSGYVCKMKEQMRITISLLMDKKQLGVNPFHLDYCLSIASELANRTKYQ